MRRIGDCPDSCISKNGTVPFAAEGHEMTIVDREDAQLRQFRSEEVRGDDNALPLGLPRLLGGGLHAIEGRRVLNEYANVPRRCFGQKVCGNVRRLCRIAIRQNQRRRPAEYGGRPRPVCRTVAASGGLSRFLYPQKWDCPFCRGPAKSSSRKKIIPAIARQDKGCLLFVPRGIARVWLRGWARSVCQPGDNEDSNKQESGAMDGYARHGFLLEVGYAYRCSRGSASQEYTV